MVVKAARESGIAVDEKDFAEQRRAMAVVMSLRQPRPLLIELGGGGLAQLSQTAVGLITAGHEADWLTDSVAMQIAAQQRTDGGWTDGHSTSRAPMEESEITTAAYCVRVLRDYAIPSRKTEFKERIGRARTWMLSAHPRHTYERADLLMGLKWAGASQEQMASVAKALAGEQRADGGWAQRSTLASDAYGTGLAMRALRESGQPGMEAVYRRGRGFPAQDADGRRIMVRAEPRNEAAAVLPVRLSVRPRPVDLLQCDGAGDGRADWVARRALTLGPLTLGWGV